MRSTVALISLITAATAAAITCEDRISFGKLDIHKNDIKTGESVPLTFDDAGRLVGSVNGMQYLVSAVPCTSAHIAKPAKTVNGDKVTVVGRLTANGGLCLSRNSADQGLALAACIDEDGPGQEAQFWTLDLVNHDGSMATGKDVPVAFVKGGMFHHLAGGKVFGALL